MEELKEKEVIKPDRVLDLKGLMCPVPIAMTQEKIKGMKEGEVLLVISTDPGFEYDLWNWAKRSGNLILDIKKEGPVINAYIKKVRESRSSSLIYWIRFHALGVKLHAKMFFIEFNPFIKKPDHFITFLSISEGLRANKMVKEEGEKAHLLPIPDAIDPNCGVVLAVRGKHQALKLFNFLKEKGIAVESIYVKNGKSFEILAEV